MRHIKHFLALVALALCAPAFALNIPIQMFWTSQAVSCYGVSMATAAANEISRINGVLGRSGSNFTVSLAGAESTILVSLQSSSTDPSDAYNDALAFTPHQKSRDKNHADLIIVYNCNANSNWAAIGGVSGPSLTTYHAPNQMLSIVNVNLLGGTHSQMTSAHEMAHLFEGRHQSAGGQVDNDPSEVPIAHAHGHYIVEQDYITDIVGNQLWYWICQWDIMARPKADTTGCQGSSTGEISYISNPSITYLGNHLYHATGSTNDNDMNALNTRSPTVVNYYMTPWYVPKANPPPAPGTTGGTPFPVKAMYVMADFIVPLMVYPTTHGWFKFLQP